LIRLQEDIVEKHERLLRSGHHPHVRAAISAAVLEAFQVDDSRDVPPEKLVKAVIAGIRAYLAHHPEAARSPIEGWQYMSVAKRIAGEIKASIRHMRGVLAQHRTTAVESDRTPEEAGYGHGV
jgi:hypothetical protein